MTPKVQTITGPVGRSYVYDSARPTADAIAPVDQEITVRARGRRVKRNAVTAGTTRKLKTISTPPIGTEKVMTIPNAA